LVRPGHPQREWRSSDQKDPDRPTHAPAAAQVRKPSVAAVDEPARASLDDLEGEPVSDSGARRSADMHGRDLDRLRAVALRGDETLQRVECLSESTERCGERGRDCFDLLAFPYELVKVGKDAQTGIRRQWSHRGRTPVAFDFVHTHHYASIDCRRMQGRPNARR
jgi:hypothetical protein